jgi:hypothetical protein
MIMTFFQMIQQFLSYFIGDFLTKLILNNVERTITVVERRKKAKVQRGVLETTIHNLLMMIITITMNLVPVITITVATAIIMVMIQVLDILMTRCKEKTLFI